ncbi:MAG: carbon-nitrogen hydrolase [Deltaproteobacteria bacterium]|nr:carbon-nitrogen hydrolase [Deltaproteobacteria bacterium]
MAKTISVGIIQQQNGPAVKANLDKLSQNIAFCADSGAQLIILMELHNTLYFCQTEDPACFDLAETIPGPSTEKLGELAKSHGVVIVASLFEKRAQGLYHNSAVAFEKDGSIAGVYRKMHIPDDPGFYEKFYFTPGDLGFSPIETSLGKIGVLVCWDQWYPEASRLMAMAGADLLVYPTAIGWDKSEPIDEQKRQLDAWITIQRSHAVANGIPVIAVNRVGFEPNPLNPQQGIDFWGNSFAIGPQGEFLIQASSDKEENLVVTLDSTRTEEVRRMWPFLRDRRIDSYQEILKRFID